MKIPNDGFIEFIVIVGLIALFAYPVIFIVLLALYFIIKIIPKDTTEPPTRDTDMYKYVNRKYSFPNLIQEEYKDDTIDVDIIEDTIVEDFTNREDILRRKKEYLKSIEWRMLKQQVLIRDNYRCTKCYSPINLNVHHITYERLFNEKPEDLITLCKVCHTKLHEDLGYDLNSIYEPNYDEINIDKKTLIL